MSDPGAEHLGWMIALKGWEKMITKPRPHYAHTQADLDWYLRTYGPAEKYEITRAPDPIRPEARAKIEQMQAEHAAKTRDDTL